MSCKDEGKGPKKTAYENSTAAKQEILNPSVVIVETIGPMGEILQPKAYSPQTLAHRRYGTIQVLKTLVTAEKIARRQYDETMLFTLFPELKPFEAELLYIRNDEYEHEMILNCIIQKLSNPTVAQPTSNPTVAQPTEQPKQASGITLTPKAIGEFYETILDRFGEEEEKSVNSYQEILVQVQKTKAALGQIQDSITYDQIAAPLNELERKINKHLNEERVHLDVIDAMQEMFSNMKLGKVY